MLLKKKKDFKSCSIKELTTLLKDKGIEFSDCLDKESLVERCIANSHLWDNELLSPISASSSSSSSSSSSLNSSSSFYYSSSSSSSSTNSFRPMFNLPPPKNSIASTTTVKNSSNMTLDLDHFSSTLSNSPQSTPTVKNSGVMTIDFDNTSSTSFSTSQPVSFVDDKYDDDDNNLNEERIIFANSNEGHLNQVIQKRPKLLFNLPPPKYT